MGREITPPEGGRLHTVRVLVNPARGWKKAYAAAGPDSRLPHYEFEVLGLKYSTTGGPEEEEIILVNFGTWIPKMRHALDWAKLHRLEPKGPYSVFAIGEHKPNLHRELGVDTMDIILPVGFNFNRRRQNWFLFLNDTRRGVGFDTIFGGFHSACWFAFGRKRKKRRSRR